MKWYVGMKIVAIRDHSDRYFKKGDVFTINGLSQSFCGCKLILVDIGKKLCNYNSECNMCGKLTYINSGIVWFGENNFAPLDDLSDYTIETLLNEIEIVNV